MNTDNPRQITGIHNKTISENPRTYRVSQTVIDRTNARPGETVMPKEEVLYEGTDHVRAQAIEDEARNAMYGHVGS